MHAAKCVLDLNRNDLADSLDFDMNLKTNPTDMIQIGIQNSPKPFEFIDLDLLAPTELIYALKTQTWA